MKIAAAVMIAFWGFVAGAQVVRILTHTESSFGTVFILLAAVFIPVNIAYIHTAKDKS